MWILYLANAMTAILSEVDTYKLDIVAIQEMRWTGSDNL